MKSFFKKKYGRSYKMCVEGFEGGRRREIFGLFSKDFL